MSKFILLTLSVMFLSFQVFTQSNIPLRKFQLNKDSLVVQINIGNWKGGIKSIELKSKDSTQLMRTLFIKGKIYKITQFHALTGVISDEYFFYSNGFLDEEKHYVSGKLSGKNITYYRSGKERMVYIYEDGILTNSKKYPRFRGNKPNQ